MLIFFLLLLLLIITFEFDISIPDVFLNSMTPTFCFSVMKMGKTEINLKASGTSVQL